MTKHRCVTFNCNSIDHINERLMRVENKLDYLHDNFVRFAERIHTLEQRLPHRSEDSVMALKKYINELSGKLHDKAAVSGVIELFNNHKDAIEQLNKKILDLEKNTVTFSRMRG